MKDTSNTDNAEHPLHIINYLDQAYNERDDLESGVKDKLLVATWDGGNDSGSIDIKLDCNYGSVEYDLLYDKINDILDYGSWAWDFHSEGSVYYDSDTKELSLKGNHVEYDSYEEFETLDFTLQIPQIYIDRNYEMSEIGIYTKDNYWEHDNNTFVSSTKYDDIIATLDLQCLDGYDSVKEPYTSFIKKQIADLVNAIQKCCVNEGREFHEYSFSIIHDTELQTKFDMTVSLKKAEHRTIDNVVTFDEFDYDNVD